MMYISLLKYARSLYEGVGLHDNLDARVEGYTNFLYVILMYLSFPLGVSPEAWIKTIGVVSIIAIMWITFRVAKGKVNLYVAGIVALAMSFDSKWTLRNSTPR